MQKRHRLEAEKKLLEVFPSLSPLPPFPPSLPPFPFPFPPLYQTHSLPHHSHVASWNPSLNDQHAFVVSQEKKQGLIDELTGKRDRAVVRTWRGAIEVPPKSQAA